MAKASLKFTSSSILAFILGLSLSLTLSLTLSLIHSLSHPPSLFLPLFLIWGIKYSISNYFENIKKQMCSSVTQQWIHGIKRFESKFWRKKSFSKKQRLTLSFFHEKKLGWITLQKIKIAKHLNEKKKFETLIRNEFFFRNNHHLQKASYLMWKKIIRKAC